MRREKFLEKARNIHGYRYKYPMLNEIVKQRDIIDVEFEGVVYQQRLLKHLKGSRPDQKIIKKTTEEFIDQSIKIWGDKYDYSQTEYESSRKKVKIIYDGISYLQYPNSHLSGYPVEGYLDQEIFLQKAKKKHGDKYDYSLVEFVNANTKIKIIYDGVTHEQTPYNHLKYSPEKVLRLKTIEEFIIESIAIHDGKYSYENAIYKSDRDKITITCPIHGDFSQIVNSHMIGKGCPTCKESFGEKAIAKFLNNNNIHYDRQHRFKGCKSTFELPFDFYIPMARTCIEFDGIQHYQPVSYFGGLETYEKLKINDKIKEDYCEENYINLIRIKYTDIDKINEILYENLKLFIK